MKLLMPDVELIRGLMEARGGARGATRGLEGGVEGGWGVGGL